MSDYMKLAALEMELENAAAAEGNFVEIRKQSYKTNIQSKPVYNDHPWDLIIVAVVDRWSLSGGDH